MSARVAAEDFEDEVPFLDALGRGRRDGRSDGLLGERVEVDGAVVAAVLSRGFEFACTFEVVFVSARIASWVEVDGGMAAIKAR